MNYLFDHKPSYSEWNYVPYTYTYIVDIMGIVYNHVCDV